MFLGRVVGRVWSTVKHPGLEGAAPADRPAHQPGRETYRQAA